jgi:hypothetical protein
LPKTGTTSVLHSLDNYREYSVLHIHTLRKERLCELEQIYIDNWDKKNNPKHLWHSLYIIQKLNNAHKNTDKYKIITMVRDPVAQHISGFFQLLYLELDYNYLKKLKQNNVDVIIDELVALFIEDFSKNYGSEDWFELELNCLFGIDIYSHAFNTERGYQIYKGERADVLLIRLEDLNKCAGEAMREFLGINDFSLTIKNVGSKKDYSALYKSFLEKIVLPEQYLEKRYNLRYVQHLYNSDELRNLKRKWTRSQLNQ